MLLFYVSALSNLLISILISALSGQWLFRTDSVIVEEYLMQNVSCTDKPIIKHISAQHISNLNDNKDHESSWHYCAVSAPQNILESSFSM